MDGANHNRVERGGRWEDDWDRDLTCYSPELFDYDDTPQAEAQARRLQAATGGGRRTYSQVVAGGGIPIDPYEPTPESRTTPWEDDELQGAQPVLLGGRLRGDSPTVPTQEQDASNWEDLPPINWDEVDTATDWGNLGRHEWRGWRLAGPRGGTEERDQIGARERAYRAAQIQRWRDEHSDALRAAQVAREERLREQQRQRERWDRIRRQRQFQDLWLGWRGSGN